MSASLCPPLTQLFLSDSIITHLIKMQRSGRYTHDSVRSTSPTEQAIRDSLEAASTAIPWGSVAVGGAIARIVPHLVEADSGLLERLARARPTFDGLSGLHKWAKLQDLTQELAELCQAVKEGEIDPIGLGGHMMVTKSEAILHGLLTAATQLLECRVEPVAELRGELEGMARVAILGLVRGSGSGITQPVGALRAAVDLATATGLVPEDEVRLWLKRGVTAPELLAQHLSMMGSEGAKLEAVLTAVDLIKEVSEAEQLSTK